MRLVAWNVLQAYGERHPNAMASLRNWRQLVGAAEWKTIQEALAASSKAKTVSASRIRYEIAGGDHRLIVAFNFDRQIAFVKFVGSHAEYDRIDAQTVSLF